MKKYFFGFLFCYLYSVSLAEKPAIFWASDPVKPNQTVLVQGDLLDGDTHLQIANIKNKRVGKPELNKVDFSKIQFNLLSSKQPSVQTGKYVIPANWDMGIYAIRPAKNGEVGKTTLVNAPDVWWLQGDEVKYSTPGGQYRIFGKCLSFGDAKVYLKDNAGKFTQMKLIEQDLWHIAIDLGNLKVGIYKVFVHNGLGGKYGWIDAGDIVLKEKAAWPEKVFNVVDYGAKPNFDPTRSVLDKTNDSPAFQRALDAAGKNGGGVVYIPKGCYRMVEELYVPRFVTIRGESQLSTSLGWTDKEEPPLGLINGTNNFAVENLSIFVQNYYSVIRADHGHTEGSGNIAVRDVTVRANRYIGVSHRTFEDWQKEYTKRQFNVSRREAVLNFGGENIVVSDCHVYASHSSIILDKASGVVSNNKLHCPNSAHSQYWIRGCHDLIMTNNDISGGGCLGTHNTSRGVRGEDDWEVYLNAVSRNIYFAGNKLKDNWKYDREFMTLDSHGYGGPYIGPVAEARDNTLTFPERFPVLMVSGEAMSKSGSVFSSMKLADSKTYKIVVKMEAKKDPLDWDYCYINFYEGNQSIESTEPERFERNGDSRYYAHGKVNAVRVSGAEGFELKELRIAKNWKELLDESSNKPVFADIKLDGNDMPQKDTGVLFDFDSDDVLYVLAIVKANGPIKIGQVELLVDGKRALNVGLTRLGGTTVDFNNIPKSPNQNSSNINLYKGAFVYVLEGKGCGQYRKIIDGKDRTLVLDRAWDVELNDTSVISVHRSHDHQLFVNNEFIDGGIAIQLYGGGVNNVIVGNTLTRAGGFVVTGLEGCASMYCQILDNTIVSGVGLGGPPCNLRGSKIGFQPYKPTGILNGYETIGMVMRGNRLENITSAVANGPVQNILIEDNYFANTETAILVNPEGMASRMKGYSPQDVFIRNNKLENVDSLLKKNKESTVVVCE